MPTVKNVGEPCAREPHARFEVAAGGNQASRLSRAAPAPLADPTTLADDRFRSPPPLGRATASATEESVSARKAVAPGEGAELAFVRKRGGGMTRPRRRSASRSDVLAVR